MKNKKLLIFATGLSVAISAINTSHAQSCSQLTGSQTCRYYWEGCGAISGSTVPSAQRANCKTWETDSTNQCGCASCNTGYTLTTVNTTYGTYPGKLTKRCVQNTSTPCTTTNCSKDMYIASDGTVWCRTNNTCTSGATGSNFGVYNTYCEDGHGKDGNGTCAPQTCPTNYHKGVRNGVPGCFQNCAANKYLNDSGTCVDCPSHNGIAGRSNANSLSITDCYIPSTSSWSFSDSTGSGTTNFNSNCYYSK